MKTNMNKVSAAGDSRLVPRLVLLLTGVRLDSHLVKKELWLAGIFSVLCVLGIVLALVPSFMMGWTANSWLPIMFLIPLLLSLVFIVAALFKNYVLPAWILFVAMLYWPFFLGALFISLRKPDGDIAEVPTVVVGMIVVMAAAVMLRPRVMFAWLLLTSVVITGALVFAALDDLEVWLGLGGIIFAGLLVMVGRYGIATLVGEHNHLEELIRRLRPGNSLESTSASAAREIREIGQFDLVVIQLLTPPERVIHLAESSCLYAPLISLPVGGDLSPKDCRYLREKLAEGPWITDQHDAPEVFSDQYRASNVGALLYVPITYQEEIIGILMVGAQAASLDLVSKARSRLTNQLAVAADAASIVGSLLADYMEEFDNREQEIQAVKNNVQRESFNPVFQPIVNLRDGEIYGYEALTRFANGERPDLVFAQAERLGFGPELELVTLTAALQEAQGLYPKEAYLSINLSPGFLLDCDFPQLLRGVRRPIVIEITEHTAIEDYTAIRAVVATLGPNIKLAVDDAGSGFASMRHVLELKPDIVKLDIGLVQNIDKDPARQALVAGMVYFAKQMHFKLVGEGVETVEERQTLHRLGVDLGQGYLFSRPGPVEKFTALYSISLAKAA
jgi:EAL domain-containing protein (putative c-di-GMP-specific phosphodiesterase class I)